MIRGAPGRNEVARRDETAVIEANPDPNALKDVAAWVERNDVEPETGEPMPSKGVRTGRLTAGAGVPHVSRFVLPASALAEDAWAPKPRMTYSNIRNVGEIKDSADTSVYVGSWGVGVVSGRS